MGSSDVELNSSTSQSEGCEKKWYVSLTLCKGRGWLCYARRRHRHTYVVGCYRGQANLRGSLRAPKSSWCCGIFVKGWKGKRDTMGSTRRAFQRPKDKHYLESLFMKKIQGAYDRYTVR